MKDKLIKNRKKPPVETQENQVHEENYRPVLALFKLRHDKQINHTRRSVERVPSEDDARKTKIEQLVDSCLHSIQSDVEQAITAQEEQIDYCKNCLDNYDQEARLTLYTEEYKSFHGKANHEKIDSLNRQINSLKTEREINVSNLNQLESEKDEDLYSKYHQVAPTARWFDR